MSPVYVARKKTDVIVLVITVLVAVIFLSIVSFGDFSVFVIVLLSLFLSLIYIRLFQVNLLANSMRVQNGKHAYLANIVNEITQALDVPPVDVYITQNPFLNAFAVGFTRPFSIVLHSEVVERLSDEEIKAILLHEVGHIKYHHTIITSYITPLSVVPIFGQLVTWIFGFWTRRAEMACDRLSAAYMGDSDPIMNALIKIHVGADIGGYMEEEGVIYQDIKGRGLTRSVAQTLQSHPFLVTRISEIIHFSTQNNIAIPENVTRYLNR